MKRYLALAIIAGLISITSHASSAAALPTGTTLTITQGIGGNTTSTSLPGTGSKFSINAFGDGNLLWTDMGPGTQTGIIIGTNQSDGGQMTAGSLTNSTPGQIDAAWKFFNAYGTDFTYATSLAPSGAKANTFASTTCTSGLGTTVCSDGSGGTTTLGSWSVSWNFSNPPDGVPMGSGLIDAWIVSGSSYTLDYRQTVPNASPVFASVPYGLHLEGNIMLPVSPTPTPTYSPTSTFTPTPCLTPVFIVQAGPPALTVVEGETATYVAGAISSQPSTCPGYSLPITLYQWPAGTTCLESASFSPNPIFVNTTSTMTVPTTTAHPQCSIEIVGIREDGVWGRPSYASLTVNSPTSTPTPTNTPTFTPTPKGNRTPKPTKTPKPR